MIKDIFNDFIKSAYTSFQWIIVGIGMIVFLICVSSPLWLTVEVYRHYNYNLGGINGNNTQFQNMSFVILAFVFSFLLATLAITIFKYIDKAFANKENINRENINRENINKKRKVREHSIKKRVSKNITATNRLDEIQ